MRLAIYPDLNLFAEVEPVKWYDTLGYGVARLPGVEGSEVLYTINDDSSNYNPFPEVAIPICPGCIALKQHAPIWCSYCKKAYCVECYYKNCKQHSF